MVAYALFFEVDDKAITLSSAVTHLYRFATHIHKAFVFLIVDREDVDLADFAVDFDKKDLFGKLIIAQIGNEVEVV